jgi:hypothetical protein
VKDRARSWLSAAATALIAGLVVWFMFGELIGAREIARIRLGAVGAAPVDAAVELSPGQKVLFGIVADGAAPDADDGTGSGRTPPPAGVVPRRGL